MRRGIGIDGFLRPAMHRKIGLFVAFQSKQAQRKRHGVTIGFDIK